MIKLDTTKLLQAEMDRKAFLKNAGIAFVGIIGVTAVVKNLNGIVAQNAPRKSSAASTFGYGGSVYGGGTVGR